MRVQLPNGQIIDGIPEGTTKEEIQSKAIKAGLAKPEDFGAPKKPEDAFKESMTAAEYADRYGDQPDIYGLIKPNEPKPEPSFIDKAKGAGEAALTAVSGATLGTAGMIAGTLKGLSEEIRSGQFGTADAANRIEDFAAKLAAQGTYEPRTPQGQEYVQALGQAGEALAPLAGLGGELAMIGQTAGRAAAPQVAQAASKASEAAKTTGEAAKAVFQYQSPTKQRIAELLEANVPSSDTARFRISTPAAENPPESRVLQYMGVGRAKVAKDKIAIDAIGQGFDEGVVAMIKGAAPSDRMAMEKMLSIYEQGRKNQLYRAENRASDVIGERLIDSINIIKKANRKAGVDIDVAARKLHGQKIDSTEIGSKFVSDLEDIGVTVTPDLKLIFKGSDIEDIPAAERIIKTVFRRMTGPDVPDAYELHRMKRFIDEQVSYGKAGEGLTGRSERILKGLRRDIDSALDKKFPEYDRANTIYSDTINTLDTVQSVAGRKLDLGADNANKQLGTLMRRVLSNAQSRTNVIDMAAEIDRVSRKYPDQLLIEGTSKGRKPDITSLVVFSDELDARFGPTARTSLQGQNEQIAERTRRIAQSSSPTMAAVDEVVGFGARAIDKARGISDEKALESMRKLLREDYQ